MGQNTFKNTFGSAASANGIDLQRADLWVVNLALPPALQATYSWQNNVQFLLEKFPFPNREREMVEVKYMQQTNWLIGKDAPTSAIEIPVRYAFTTQVAETLEAWYYLVANPTTGGVGLTTQCKSQGLMTWMVPNMANQVNDIGGNAQPGVSTLTPGLAYTLEGCLIKGLKYSDASQTESGYVNLQFNLQMDRYYPSTASWNSNLVVNPVLP
jgi:hypothetical protein